jgi:pimeloyl-ACP methyl ester carboxylesterase
MGGYMALAYVLKYASDLRGLMLIDTRAEADTPAGKEARSKMIQSVRTGGAKAVADEMFPKMMFEQLLAKNPAVAMKLRQAMESQNPKTIENAIIALRDRPDRIASLPTIDVPTLVVVGEHDVITPPAMSQTLEKSIPSATLVSIANAGHMSPMEQPDDVTTAIRRFAESVTK